jgi:glycine hydroxymethyltransferase
MEHLKKTDPEIYQVLVKEYERQFYHLEMIASENFTSLAVMAAHRVLCLLTNMRKGCPAKDTMVVVSGWMWRKN